jgi:hypothetical protein
LVGNAVIVTAAGVELAAGVAKASTTLFVPDDGADGAAVEPTFNGGTDEDPL